jgi:hypothetical protein
MRRVFQVSFTVAAAVLAFAALRQFSAKGLNSVPATLDFRDATGDMIRSDSVGSYQNGIDCVISEVFGNGEYFLRTVGYGCSTTAPRSVVLDFSNPVTPIPPADCSVTDPNFPSLTLNICRTNNVADTRLIVSTMFTVKALTNGSSVSLPFSLAPNYSGTDFELDSEQAVAVSGTSGVRTAEAGPAAVAELYEFETVRGKTQKVSVGRYYMPFQVTVGE